jgi:hypothetical protein
MKISLSMKTSLFAILLGSAIFATQNASATLLVGFHLVGFHDFDGTVADESADYALAGFSGTVTKNGGVGDSVTGGGSNDGLYGNTVYPAFYKRNPGINDGYLRSLNEADPVFRFTNASFNSISLANLLFDTASSSGGSFQVDYRTTASPVTWTSLYNTGPTSIVSGAAGTSANYNDFAASLVGITLATGKWIEFRFDGAPNGRLDNIALTSLSAIPEPASLLALGCLMGSGVFLRQRRRTAGAALQLA